MDRVTAALRRDLELADRIARDRQSERDALLVERHATRLELDALRGEMAALERRNADLVRQLQDILGSRSWRWTAPFRDAARRLGRRSR
jgi:hypothetical protein